MKTYGINIAWSLSGPCEQDAHVRIGVLDKDYRVCARYEFDFRRYGLTTLLPEMLEVIEEEFHVALGMGVQTQLHF